MVAIIIIGATWVLPQARSPPALHWLCVPVKPKHQMLQMFVSALAQALLSPLCVQMLTFPQDPLHILLLLWKLLLIPPAEQNLS